jgi:hypothetical protein
MKVLVLTSEAVSADALREAIGAEDAEQAEVMVVSPATQRSKIRFWLSDADDAIERAESVQEETVERLDEEGIDAAGDTGESDPLLALEDTLATFDADRVIVFRHPEDDRDHLEDEWLGEARERIDVPIEERLVTRSSQGERG